ncbi:MAG: hypothetical protein H0W25_09685 [Acidimicrobiia bacterium]|nr:hypothetical protein [Acidimicrobiia bacterium]
MGGFRWFPDVIQELGLPPPPLSRSPLLLATGLREALAAAGFHDAVTTTVEERFTFGGIEHYEAWCRSHGGRQLLVALDEQPDVLFRWRELTASRLAADDHVLVQTVDLTVAARA